MNNLMTQVYKKRLFSETRLAFRLFLVEGLRHSETVLVEMCYLYRRTHLQDCVCVCVCVCFFFFTFCDKHHQNSGFYLIRFGQMRKKSLGVRYIRRRSPDWPASRGNENVGSVRAVGRTMPMIPIGGEAVALVTKYTLEGQRCTLCLHDIVPESCMTGIRGRYPRRGGPGASPQRGICPSGRRCSCWRPLAFPGSHLA